MMAAPSRLAPFEQELAEVGPIAFKSGKEVNVRNFLTVAPGSIWAAIIVGLILLAEWMSAYFGAVTWVVPLAALIATVIVPVLKVLAQDDAPAGRAMGEVRAYRSRFSLWLW
jgi:uncharacterized membrane protein